MDKQEMVICPMICSVFTGCKHRGEHSRMTGCDGGDGCPACVPAEPAQPELPRELPLVEDPNPDPYDYEGINSAWDSGAEYQHTADQLILNKWTKACDLALTRIAELEATLRQFDILAHEERVANRIEGKKFYDDFKKQVAQLEEENKKLKNQSMEISLAYAELEAENASLKEQLAVWLEKCIGCPLCPVPAKEEQ